MDTYCSRLTVRMNDFLFDLGSFKDYVIKVGGQGGSDLFAYYGGQEGDQATKSFTIYSNIFFTMFYNPII